MEKVSSSESHSKKLSSRFERNAPNGHGLRPGAANAPPARMEALAERTRLVFVDSSVPELSPFEATASEIAELARRERWCLGAVSNSQPNIGRLGAISWSGRDGAFEVHLFEPRNLPWYGVLTVSGGGDVRESWERIRALKLHAEPSDLVLRFESEPRLEVRAALLLALAYALPSQRVLDERGLREPDGMWRRFDAALASTDKGLTRAAIQATGLLRWWSLRERLVGLCMTAKHPCRQEALRVLEAWPF